MLKGAINGKTGHAPRDCGQAKVSAIEVKMIDMLIKEQTALDDIYGS